MKRRLLCIFLALSMVLTLLPFSVMAEEDTAIDISGGITPIAPIDETEASGETTPATPTDQTEESGETIPVAPTDQTEESGETIPVAPTDQTEETVEIGISAQALELPFVALIGTTGYTSLQAAINSVEEGQTIELLDNILAEPVIIHYNKSFTLDLKGNTLDSGTYTAIVHYGNGTLTISDTTGGGKITSSGADNGFGSNSGTIYLYNDKTFITMLEITGGIIENTGTGSAISNHGYGNLLISGGMVENTAAGKAIYNYGYGIVEIAGGTIRAANGIGIYNGFDVVRITGGPSTIMGGDMAMNRTPDAYYYTNVKIMGSTHADGIDASEILDEGFDAELYKYLRFEQGTAKAAYIGYIGYYTLQAAFDAVTKGDTIRLHSDITLDAAITITGDESKSFTLNLNGRTLDSGTNAAIEHRGSGALTITGTLNGGKITSTNTSSGTISLVNNGSLVVSRCTVENTATGKAVYNNGNGSVSISDAAVCATDGTAIYNEFGIVKISNASTIMGGNMALNTTPDLSYYTYLKITGSMTNTDGTGASEITKGDIDTVTKIQVYKYLKFEQGEQRVAKIGTTYYPTLQAAVDAVTDGDTIELLEDITLTTTVTSRAVLKNFTLDLKGNTMDSGTNTAITYDGYVSTLTITDTVNGGKVTSKNPSSGTILLTEGELVISGGTIENTFLGGTTISCESYGILNVAGGTVIVNNGTAIYNNSIGTTIINGTVSADNGTAIYNNSTGTITINGTVHANNGTAIYNNSTGLITISDTATVTNARIDSGSVADSDSTICLNDGEAGKTVLEITGGTIENTAAGNAIYNISSGSVSISSGMVSANNGTAIYNENIGKITISGTATVTSSKMGSGSGTIYLKDGEAGKTVLEIKGGTIENTATGNAIYNIGSGSVSVLNGTSTIKGGNMAINVAPDLSYYVNLKITASISNAEGTDASVITRDGIDTNTKVQVYKYLKFEPSKVAQIGTTSYTTLQAAIDAVPIDGTIELLKDSTLTAAVTINNSNNKSFTLDLNGKTIDSGTNGAIGHWGSGTLTITDTANGGKITSKNTSSGTIRVDEGHLVVSAGTVENTSSVGYAITSNGTVSVTGGAVSTTTCTTIDNSGKLVISGGTVENIGKGYAIINFGDGIIEVTGGTVSAADGTAIENLEYGTVNVSGGTVSANGSRTIASSSNGNITISNTGLVTNGSNTPTILLRNDMDIMNFPLKITGGTVENTAEASAIYNMGEGIVEVTGGTVSSTGGTAIEILPGGAYGPNQVRVSGGISTFKGGYITMAIQPNLIDFNNVRITASKKTDGTDPFEITLYDLDTYSKFKTYKYLKFEPATAPDAPSNLTATPLNRELRLTWDDPANNGGREILGYKISTDNGSSWTENHNIYNPRIVNGLTNGATYTVLVRAFNEIGDGPTSDSITVTLPVPTYAIKGTIKDIDTNLGIAGAVIQLKNGDSNVGSPVLTDSNGAYTISNVISGTYSIEVSADGYDRGTISSFFIYYNATNKNLALDKIGKFTSVTDIAMTNDNTMQIKTDLILSGTVSPDTATNRTITWSIENANGTGAIITGNTFKATSAGIATVKATITNGLTSSSDYTKSFTIKVTPVPVVNHTITATADAGGSISPDGSVTIHDGTSQTYTITPSSNYSIADVKVDGVSQGSITSYTFHKVTDDHTILATFSYNGSGGGSNIDGDSSVDSKPVIIIPPAPDKPNSPTQGEIKVYSTVDGKGNAAVYITNETVTEATHKALADAKKNGNEENGITLVFYVSTDNSIVNKVTVNLPKTVQDTLIANKIKDTVIIVDNPDIRIDMDLAAIKEINKQAKSDVDITATPGGKLTGAGKKAIGGRPIFDLKVNYGNGKSVKSFGKSNVSVTIPYILSTKENAGNVCAVYVDGKGKVHWLTNSVYDSVEQVLRFSTNHFSTYGIGYKQTKTSFTDIASHWSKEAIEFVLSRGMLSSTSTTTFSPNTAITRGMFVTALGRLANADVSKYKKSSFTDVKENAYYMGYIEWANKNNILNGTVKGKFAPNQSITREQMAVIMYKYAKVIGFTLPKVHEENIFADSAKISADAKDAVKQMQMAGVISSKKDNLFDPQGKATRAEVSAMLHRFVELMISSDTMQGWKMNDSGQWMYYENGKPVNGKKDIDGLTYTFNSVTTDVPKNLK